LVLLGYIPGERIQFAVQIDNRSKRKINPLKVEFYERITFYDRSVSKYSSDRVIATVSNNQPVEPLKTYEWKGETFDLPPMCHTSNGLCRIIDLKYGLRLNFSISGSVSSIIQSLWEIIFSSSIINIPITIGKSFFVVIIRKKF
jgi:hypothetical protein